MSQKLTEALSEIEGKQMRPATMICIGDIK